MKFSRLQIPDLIHIEPQVHLDVRGYFTETFRQDKLENFLGRPLTFLQDNESESSQGVFRGLHYQLPPYAQTKLVRVVSGTILDIAVDIRKNSPTFGQHVQTELSAKRQNQLFVPQGFAHGFVVLSPTAKICYKVDNYYHPEADRSLNVSDPALDLNLPVEDWIRSVKDINAPMLHQADLFE